MIRKYKGYVVEIVGLSHHIWRNLVDGSRFAHGYAQSMVAAKRWINSDRGKRED